MNGLQSRTNMEEIKINERETVAIKSAFDRYILNYKTKRLNPDDYIIWKKMLPIRSSSGYAYSANEPY